MDTAVALVQAYLNVNGYFTVVEYPVLEAYRGRPARSVTDLDILAFRFAGAGHEVIRGHKHAPLGGRAFEPDPVLALLEKWGAVEAQAAGQPVTGKGAT